MDYDAIEEMIKFSYQKLHRPERILVTKKLLNSIRSAHSTYIQKSEEEREEKEKKKKRPILHDDNGKGML